MLQIDGLEFRFPKQTFIQKAAPLILPFPTFVELCNTESIHLY